MEGVVGGEATFRKGAGGGMGRGFSSESPDAIAFLPPPPPPFLPPAYLSISRLAYLSIISKDCRVQTGVYKKCFAILRLSSLLLKAIFSESYMLENIRISSTV